MDNQTINLEKTKHLLSRTQRLLKQEEEVRKLKGEDFNLFSILNVEFKEDSTHSAFIAELLNPKGSHHKGDLFLRLFLDIVLKDNEVLKAREQNEEVFADQFLRQDIQVFREHSIGKVNFSSESGGRIDILLKSGDNLITIENKIHAKDQYLQLARYYNHRTNNNLVYYLTLFGNKPSNESIGEFSIEQFHCISYAEHILSWIKECLMYAHNEPILRESLKQYALLIKKLTHQMDNQSQEELHNLIIEQLNAAETISKNIESAKQNLRNQFRNNVIDGLKLITEKYDLNIKIEHSSGHSQLRLESKIIERPVVDYCITSFSGYVNADYDGSMYYGLRVRQGNPLVAEKIKSIFPSNEATNWWPHSKYIEGDNQLYLKLSENDVVKKLTDLDFQKQQIERIVNDVENFIASTYNTFLKVNKESQK